jgi:hypothetical protein
MKWCNILVKAYRLERTGRKPQGYCVSVIRYYKPSKLASTVWPPPYIPEVLSSNLCGHTDYPHRFFVVFLSPCRQTPWTSPAVRSKAFLSTSLPIHYSLSSSYSTSHNLSKWNVYWMKLNWMMLVYYIIHYYIGPPLWSSGQSSWLQIRSPGFDSRYYQEKKVVGLERGPLSLVSTTEELLDRKVAAPV